MFTQMFDESFHVRQSQQKYINMWVLPSLSEHGLHEALKGRPFAEPAFAFGVRKTGVRAFAFWTPRCHSATGSSSDRT